MNYNHSYMATPERGETPPARAQSELSPQQELRLNMLGRAHSNELIWSNKVAKGIKREIIVRDEKNNAQTQGIPITEQTVHGMQIVREALYQGLARTPEGDEAAKTVLDWVERQHQWQQEKEREQRDAITKELHSMWNNGAENI
jgi:hypothetical protein